MDCGGATSSDDIYPLPFPVPEIGCLTEPLTLQQLKEFTWGGPEPDPAFADLSDDEYGQMFVYDTKKGSNEGIKAALNKAQLFEGDPKYEKLLFNLTEEQRKHEEQEKNHEDLHWEVIVDTKSLDAVTTFVFEKEINN